MVRTVSMMPFPALDRIWSMLDANVRKVDWVLLVVTTVWGVGPTSFSTTRIHDRSRIWIACTSLTSSIRCGYYSQSSLSTSRLRLLLPLQVLGISWYHLDVSKQIHQPQDPSQQQSRDDSG